MADDPTLPTSTAMMAAEGWKIPPAIRYAEHEAYVEAAHQLLAGQLERLTRLLDGCGHKGDDALFGRGDGTLDVSAKLLRCVRELTAYEREVAQFRPIGELFPEREENLRKLREIQAELIRRGIDPDRLPPPKPMAVEVMPPIEAPAPPPSFQQQTAAVAAIEAENREKDQPR